MKLIGRGVINFDDVNTLWTEWHRLSPWLRPSNYHIFMDLWVQQSAEVHGLFRVINREVRLSEV